MCVCVCGCKASIADAAVILFASFSLKLLSRHKTFRSMSLTETLATREWGESNFRLLSSSL